MISFHWIVVLSTTLLLVPTTARTPNITYIGPKPCPDNESILGYTDFLTLNDDITSQYLDVHKNNKAQMAEYLYKLCPNTVFPYNRTNDYKDVITPLMHNTTIQCGGNGSSDDSCILSGGQFQLAFLSDIIVQNVTIRGLTFTKNKQISVGGWGLPGSLAVFDDCHWKGNRGASVVQLLYDPPYRRRKTRKLRGIETINIDRSSVNEAYKQVFSKSSNLDLEPSKTEELVGMQVPTARRTQGYLGMILSFQKCSFTDNEERDSIISNSGGLLHLLENEFSRNTVGFSIVSNAHGGQMMISANNSITRNDSPAFTVFMDNDSHLLRNKYMDDVGDNSAGIDDCNDAIFVEGSGSHCMFGGFCHGTCCDFGDESCDDNEESYVLPAFLSEDEGIVGDSDISSSTFAAGKASVNAYSTENVSNSNGEANGAVIAVATLIPLLVIALGLTVWKLLKRGSNTVPRLGNEPSTPVT